MTETRQYVRTDEHGVMRVGGTRVPLEAVVYLFRDGESPEGIIRNYRSLTLEEAYGAIAFYLANRADVDGYVARQEERFEALRAEQDCSPAPVVRRLRALARERDTAGRAKGAT